MTRFRGRLLQLYIRFHTLADNLEVLDANELLTELELSQDVHSIEEKLRLWSLDQNDFDVIHTTPHLPKHPTDKLTTIDEVEWEISVHCTKSDFKQLARMIARLRIQRCIRMFAVNENSNRQVSVDIYGYTLKDEDFTDDYQ